MSRITTYEINDPIAQNIRPIVSPHLVPGCMVTHGSYGGSGMLVSIDEHKMCVLWSTPPVLPNDFSKFVFPLVKRVFPIGLAQDIISIQPMSQPTGLIFYLNYVYGQKLTVWQKICRKIAGLFDRVRRAIRKVFSALRPRRPADALTQKWRGNNIELPSNMKQLLALNTKDKNGTV